MPRDIYGNQVLAMSAIYNPIGGAAKNHLRSLSMMDFPIWIMTS